MRILFALAGLHRIHRGAEVAIVSVARELIKLGNEVTLIGSGAPRPDEPYRYIQVPSVSRTKFERWPSFPALRNDTSWEEATFVPGLLKKYRPGDFDITATCAYPWTNWALRRPAFARRKPRHVFITQNGDWPAVSDQAEFRFFGCDGLVCTNPEYFERNSGRYQCALISNGVDLERFHPGPSERERLGLPASGPIVLMVSALIASKNVAEGIRAVAKVPNANLVIAGDGPLRNEIYKLAGETLPGRFQQITLSAAQMPALYRSVDAFMHLSVEESFGNVFVEALASGLPIVAYDIPKTRWIIGDANFFPRGRTPDDLAASIAKALKAGLRDSVDECVQRFSWGNVARQYADFFRALHQGPTPRSLPTTAV